MPGQKSSSLVGKVHLMPKKYDPETRAKAIRLVRDHVGDHASEYDAIRATASSGG
jgi:transposase